MNNCNCQVGQVPPAKIYNKADGKCGSCCGLHTVTIPKTKGSSAPGQPLAPVNGAFKDTVVVYELDGSIYLYDSVGVYTPLTGGQLAAVIQELQEQLDALTSQVATVQNNLDTEVTNRQNAQTELQATITLLQQQLQAETTSRETADTDFTNQLNTLQTQVTENTQGLATEVTNRTEADTNLQDQINNINLNKQDELVSGSNIKTVNGQTILGEGNIDITGGGGSEVNVVQTTGTSTTDVMSQNAVTEAMQENSTAVNEVLDQLTTQVAAKQNQLVSGTNLKTVNGESLLGEGDVAVSTTVTLIGKYTFVPDTATSGLSYDQNDCLVDSIHNSITVYKIGNYYLGALDLRITAPTAHTTMQSVLFETENVAIEHVDLSSRAVSVDIGYVRGTASSTSATAFGSVATLSSAGYSGYSLTLIYSNTLPNAQIYVGGVVWLGLKRS